MNDWFDKYSGVLAGLMLFGVGAYLSCYGGFWHELSQALMVAGILTIAVDPFLKRKLLREASKDIFQYMLGFSLPEPIRERLHSIISETKLYRENMTSHYALSEVGEFIQIDVEQEYEIVNPTLRKINFEPHLQFEKGENPNLKSIICFDNPQYGKGAALTPNSKEPSSLEYFGRVVKLPSKQRRRFKYQYSVQIPFSVGYYFPYFQYPTIGLALSIKHDPSLVVTATPATSQLPGEWRYAQLFMPGDHIDVRWERK